MPGMPGTPGKPGMPRTRNTREPPSATDGGGGVGGGWGVSGSEAECCCAAVLLCCVLHVLCAACAACTARGQCQPCQPSQPSPAPLPCPIGAFGACLPGCQADFLCPLAHGKGSGSPETGLALAPSSMRRKAYGSRIILFFPASSCSSSSLSGQPQPRPDPDRTHLFCAAGSRHGNHRSVLDFCLNAAPALQWVGWVGALLGGERGHSCSVLLCCCSAANDLVSGFNNHCNVLMPDCWALPPPPRGPFS